MQSEPIRGVISKCPTCNEAILHTVIPDYIRIKMANISNNKLAKGICLNCKPHIKNLMEESLKKLEKIENDNAK